MPLTHQFAAIELPAPGCAKRTTRFMRRIRTAAFALLFATVHSEEAQANFLETLFGISRSAPSPNDRPSNPLHVTVSGKVKKARTRRVRQSTTAIEAAMPRKPEINASDPHWYLKDTTLRRGDIVVLKNRVLVFQGDARGISLSSFQDLKRTKGAEQSGAQPDFINDRNTDRPSAGLQGDPRSHAGF